MHFFRFEQPVQQVYIDVESHELRDRDTKDLSGLHKPSDLSVNDFATYGVEKARIPGPTSGESAATA